MRRYVAGRIDENNCGRAVTRDFGSLRSPILEGMKMARPVPTSPTMLLRNLLKTHGNTIPLIESDCWGFLLLLLLLQQSALFITLLRTAMVQHVRCRRSLK